MIRFVDENETLKPLSRMWRLILRHEILPPFGGKSTFLTVPKTIFEISVNPGRNHFYYEVGLSFLKISAVKMSSIVTLTHNCEEEMSAVWAFPVRISGMRFVCIAIFRSLGKWGGASRLLCLLYSDSNFKNQYPAISSLSEDSLKSYPLCHN